MERRRIYDIRMGSPPPLLNSGIISPVEVEIHLKRRGLIPFSMNFWHGEIGMSPEKAIRRQQLEKMTREVIISTWKTATQTTDLTTKKPLGRLIYEILEIEFPLDLNSSPD